MIVVNEVSDERHDGEKKDENSQEKAGCRFAAVDFFYNKFIYYEIYLNIFKRDATMFKHFSKLSFPEL